MPDLASPSPAQGRLPPALPPAIERALWRGDQLGSSVSEALSSGFTLLDAELPGSGWPCRSLTELLQPQGGVLEWRLLGPVLRSIVAAGKAIVLVGPPRDPHLPGLHHTGIDDKHLVWVRAEAPSERLWSAEQLIRSNAFGALIAWLPQARPEQIRRLQVGAQACDGPVFLCRPLAARHETSAAPLRVIATLGDDWDIEVQVFKRRGPAHDGTVRLRAVPGGLESILTPRLQRPTRLIASREVPADAVGRAASSTPRRQHAAVR